jgi:galactonate dehydratase
MTPTIRSAEPFAAEVSAKTVWTFVKLTDSDGVVGWGEATLNGSEDRLLEAFARHRPTLIGRAALPELPPPKPDLPDAAIVSAVDQALWDIAARRAGRSMGALLGNVARSGIPIYANVNRRTLDRTPAGFAASATKAIRRGFGTVKIAPFDGMRPGWMDGLDAGIARVAAVKAAIGTGRKLFVDCHWRFDEAGAARALDALAEIGIDWFECPIQEVPANASALRRLRARANAIGALLAGCETEIGLDGFRPYIDSGAYDVIMPDAKYAGGLAEFIRIAGYAAARGVGVAPHNPSGPICHAASLQLCAVVDGFRILEHQFDESPLFDDLVVEALPAVDGGIARAPAGHGLGVSLNEALLAPLSAGFLKVPT